MSLPARINLVTLGVADVASATRFYEQLGWRASPASQPTVTFLHGSGCVLALYGAHSLTTDAGLGEVPGDGFGGITLAVNVATPAEVDALLAAAEAAGARITRRGHHTDWGGYVGYFADLDGHVWEAAHNPSFPLDAAGLIELP